MQFSNRETGYFHYNSGQTKILRIFFVNRTCHYSDGGSLVFIRVQQKNIESSTLLIVHISRKERTTDCFELGIPLVIGMYTSTLKMYNHGF